MCVKDLEAKNSAAAKTASTKRKSVPGGKENDPKTAKVDGKGDILQTLKCNVILSIFIHYRQETRRQTERLCPWFKAREDHRSHK